MSKGVNSIVLYEKKNICLLLFKSQEDWYYFLLYVPTEKGASLPKLYTVYILSIYEPVQVFTLIWAPQRCKGSSSMIWIWWYPRLRLKKLSLSQLSDGISCLSWWFAIFMAKIGLCQEMVRKAFFAAVKLHCLTSENKFSHNSWCNGWMSMCSEMLGSLALQW